MPQSVSSVAQLCPTLCNPMDCSTPCLPVHHQLLELMQTHVHWFGDAYSKLSLNIYAVVTNSEKAMAPRSSTLAWKIPWTEEPGRLHSMGSLRVGHDWSDLAAAATGQMSRVVLGRPGGREEFQLVFLREVRWIGQENLFEGGERNLAWGYGRSKG